MTEDDYWKSVTDDPDFIRKYFDDKSIDTSEIISTIIQSFPEDPKSILEIGCGYGRLTSKIKEIYPEALVSGIDINHKILEKAEEFSGFKNKMESQNVSEFPFYYCRDNLDGMSKQDVIYSVTVFQHLPSEKKKKYIEESSKILRKNGTLIIQFIHGQRNNFVDHWVDTEIMKKWFEDSGLIVKSIEVGLVHNEWTWIVGIK